jgi:branched-chain amino acid transport system ATP-binding protein
MPLLKVEKMNGFYGDIQVLFDISININENEVVSIIGANGAGKSTLLKIISGLMKPKSGIIEFNGERIDTFDSHKIVDKGIVQIPEGRKLFPLLTVKENLEVGAHVTRANKLIQDSLQEVYQLFPILKEREDQLARTLSGGEQQMLAIARGLMAKPCILMFDEPSLGLAPLLVKNVFETIMTIKKQGITVLLVEQNVHHALDLCDRGYVLENGRIVLEGNGKELLTNPEVKRAYLGI